jgi:hypothetical protein
MRFPSSIVLAACATALLFTGPSASVVSAQGRGARSSARTPRERGPRDADHPAVRQYRRLKILRGVLGSDLNTAPAIRQAHADRERLLASLGNREARTAQRLWFPLAQNPEVRKITVQRVQRAIARESDAMREAIAARPDQAVFDTVFVGASITTSGLANEIVGRDPHRSMLAIDADDVVAGTLRRLGELVPRNSTNYAEDGDPSVTRGRGQKTPLRGPVGDEDINGSGFPGVGSIADTVTLNLFSSGVRFLMGTKAEKLEMERRDRGSSEGSWPAPYRLRTADGLTVYAKQIVTATGTDPKAVRMGGSFGKRLRARQKKLQSKPIEPGDPTSVPTFLTGYEALVLGNAARSGRDLYRAIRRPDPLQGREPSATRIEALRSLAGSGETKIEGRVRDADGKKIEKRIDLRDIQDVMVDDRTWLVRTAKKTYAFERVTVGDKALEAGDRRFQATTADSLPDPTAPTTAVIGGGDSGKSFLRWFYGTGVPESAYTGPDKNDVAQLGGVGPVKFIVGKNGPPDCDAFLNRTRAVYLSIVGKLKPNEKGKALADLVAKDFVTAERRLDPETNRVRWYLFFDKGKTDYVIADRAVLARGTDSKARLKELLGRRVDLEAVESRLDGLEGKRPYALKVKDEEVYVAGIASLGSGPDVVKDDEIFKSPENKGSVYAWARRLGKLAKRIVKGDRAKVRFDDGFLNAPPRESVTAVQGTGQAELAVQPARFRGLPSSNVRTTELKAGIADALDRFSFRGLDRVSLTVGRSADGEAKFVVKAPGLDKKAVDALAAEMARDPELVRSLVYATGAGRPVKIDAGLRTESRGRAEKVVDATDIEVGLAR